jgi:TP901-1 family phage major tail protein
MAIVTTGNFDGNFLGLYIGSDLIAYTTGAKLSIKGSEIDITSKDSAGWKQILSGLKDWSVTCDSLFAYDATYGAADLFASLVSGADVTIELSTSQAGDFKFTGAAKVMGLDVDAPKDDVVKYNVSFTGNGELTYVVIP